MSVLGPVQSSTRFSAVDFDLLQAESKFGNVELASSVCVCFQDEFWSGGLTQRIGMIDQNEKKILTEIP